MDLIYPINLIGHDEWMQSGYDLNLASGEVVTRDGEVIGQWNVTNYDPDAEYGEDEGGCFEFTPTGHDQALITEEFAFLDFRISRGLALSTICREIRNWYDRENPEHPIT